MKEYPDISELIERKRRHRRRLAALPFEQKMEIVFKLRERREFFHAARAGAEARRRRGPAEPRQETDGAGGGTDE